MYYDENKILYLQESYKRGVKDGLFIQYSSEGKYWRSKLGKRGKSKVYGEIYTSGKLMFEVNFNNGKLDGPGKVYYANGKIQKEGKYVNDLMEGPWFIYNENGGLTKFIL
jgi:antitoxin component YwqK of YwqJK toxin-antitoxin module